LSDCSNVSRFCRAASSRSCASMRAASAASASFLSVLFTFCGARSTGIRVEITDCALPPPPAPPASPYSSPSAVHEAERRQGLDHHRKAPCRSRPSMRAASAANAFFLSVPFTCCITEQYSDQNSVHWSTVSAVNAEDTFQLPILQRTACRFSRALGPLRLPSALPSVLYTSQRHNSAGFGIQL
jgi:hypothetical protein